MSDQPEEQSRPDEPGGDGAEAPARRKRRLLPRRSTAPAGDAGDAATVDGAEAAPPARSESAGRLRRRRRRLLTQREEAVYHLGGLAFELYRRDRLGESVMRVRAGEVARLDDTVRDIDVRLGEIARERRQRRAGPDPHAPVGSCLDCRAPFRAEARFCWQCGARLAPETEGDDQPTAVIAGRPGEPPRA